MDIKLKGLMEGLAGKQAKLNKIIDQATAGGKGLDFTAVTEVSGTDTEKAASFRAINDDCTVAMKALEEYRTELKAVDEAKKRAEIVREFKMPGAVGETKGGKQEKQYASLADAMVEHKFGALEMRNKEIDIPGLSLKTLMDETSWVPQVIRTGKLVDKAVRPIQVIDLIPAGKTDMIAIRYMEETTLVDAASETNESTVAGGDSSYPETQMAFTQKDSLVRKVAVFLPVTEEQLEDVSQVSGLINNRLPAMIMRRLDSQLVNGTGIGTPTQLQGILNTAGIQAYARATNHGDVPVDALRRAMTLIHTVAFSIPNGVLMHPLDWEGIRLMKSTQGVYIWGHPSESGLDRVWGLPLAQCDSIAAGTAIVADFQQSELAEKRGISVLTSNSHSDWFIKDKLAVKASGRWAFVIYRPAAFVQVNLA